MANRLGLDTAMDLELLELWGQLLAHEEIQELPASTLYLVGLFMRCSWARGVEAAIQEPERIIELVASNGYGIPRVRT